MKSPLSPTEQKAHVWQTVAEHIRGRIETLKEQLVKSDTEPAEVRGRIRELRKLLEDLEPEPRYTSHRQQRQAESPLTGEAQ